MDSFHLSDSSSSEIQGGNIIIAGASSGWGHMQAALNLREWLLKINPFVQVSVMDAYEYVSSPTRFISKTLWQTLTMRYHSVYRGLHSLLIQSPWVWTVTQEKGWYYHYIGSKPLAFVATHPAAVALGVGVKKRTGCRLFVLSTDFLFHNLYCSPHVDTYFVAPGSRRVGRVAKNPLTLASVCALYEVGLPLGPRFDEQIDPRKARVDLGLDKNRFTIVVSFGGQALGFRRNVDLVGELIDRQPNAQWLLIAGRDKQLRSYLTRVVAKRWRRKRVRVEGFVTDMANVMAAANVLVGKAGGLTVAEALHMHVPLAIVDTLPGQEEYNARLVLERQLGI